MRLALQKLSRALLSFRWFCVLIWISIVLPMMTPAQTTQSDDEVVVKKVVVPKYIRIPVAPNEGKASPRSYRKRSRACRAFRSPLCCRAASSGAIWARRSTPSRAAAAWIFTAHSTASTPTGG